MVSDWSRSLALTSSGIQELEPMTNRNQTFKRKLDAFEQAIRDQERKGGRDIADHPAIEENYRTSRHALIKYHAKLRNHSVRQNQKDN